jgi:hypothetical protein
MITVVIREAGYFTGDGVWLVKEIEKSEFDFGMDGWNVGGKEHGNHLNSLNLLSFLNM